MYVMTKEFSAMPSLPRSVRDFSSVAKQRRVLEAIADLLDEAYEVDGNLNYIRTNPGQFETFDAQALEEARHASREIVRDLKEKAELCRQSVEQCNKPQDPSFPQFSVTRRGGVTEPVTPPPLPPPQPAQWVSLDPTGHTQVGTVSLGEYKTLELRGVWNPGPDRPCYGPLGANDPNVFPPLGRFAFGAQYRFLDLDTGTVYQDWTSYLEPVKTPQGVRVYVRMYDTVLRDNHQCTPPMRAILN